MKVCSKCKVEKDVGEFSKSKRERDGLQFQCKECNRKYRQENRERILERKQKYYQENRERLREYKQKYRQESRESRRVYNRKYYQENRESRRKYYRKYRLENLDSRREYDRKYRQDNPEVFRNQLARRRARKVNATVERFTHDELVDYWVSRRINPNLCWYCEEQPFEHVEHMTPLSRGGYHAKFNMVPSCGPCNRNKSTKTVEEFIDYLEAQQRDEAT